MSIFVDKGQSMRSDMLIGVKFATNEKAKFELLQSFTRWKASHEESTDKEYEEFAVKLYGLLGFDEQALRASFFKEREITSGIPSYGDVKELMKEDNCRHYYITPDVLEMCQKIKIKEPFDLGWLLPLQDGKKQLNFGKQFLRYSKQDNKIIASSIYANPIGNDQAELSATFFQFDLNDKFLSESVLNNPDNAKKAPFISMDNFHRDSQKALIKLVTFMELAEIQEVVVAPGTKNGVRKAPDHFMNTDRFPVTVVKTNWNKTIRTEGFEVGREGPFVRMQAWGPNHSLRKPVLIQPFFKKGYNLGAQKQKDQKPKPGRRR